MTGHIPSMHEQFSLCMWSIAMASQNIMCYGNAEFPISLLGHVHKKTSTASICTPMNLTTFTTLYICLEYALSSSHDNKV